MSVPLAPSASVLRFRGFIAFTAPSWGFLVAYAGDWERGCKLVERASEEPGPEDRRSTLPAARISNRVAQTSAFEVCGSASGEPAFYLRRTANLKNAGSRYPASGRPAFYQ